MSLYELPDLRPFRSIQHRMRLVGGATVTQHGLLCSDDYIPGVQGWCIFGDGTCEFNDGIFRGSIDAAGLNIRIEATDDGAIEFYDINGILVGRLTADSWELGDLTTPGLRTTLDPLGGLRFRGATDLLLALVDQQGIYFTDEATGTVVAQLSNESMTLTDPATANQMVLSTRSTNTMITPRWTGNIEATPGSSLVSPAGTIYGANDLELAHTAVALGGTAQAGTFTPPAGWTEVIDNDYGAGSTLAVSIASRQPATGTAGTFTSSQSNWQGGLGARVIIRGEVGGTAPSIRSTSQLEQTTTATSVNLAINKPAGATTDDTLIIFVSMYNHNGGVPLGWTTPPGWIQLGALPYQIPFVGTLAVGCWARKCLASDGSTFNTNINFAVGTKIVQAHCIAVQNAKMILGGPQFSVNDVNILGSWLPWSATLTNFTKGNGTEIAAYMVQGKVCNFRYRFTLGSTSAFTGTLTISLPVASAQVCAASANFRDASAAGLWSGSLFISTGLSGHTPAASPGQLTAVSPFTWATGDFFQFGGCYETT